MAAVWMRFRAELRSRLPAILSLTLIVGILGGVVIAAAAGARRTESAYPRFLEAQNAMNIVLDPVGKDSAQGLREVEHLPDVAEFSTVNILFAAIRAENGKTLFFPDVFSLAAIDGRFGRTLNSLKILSGRAAHPDDPSEAVASFPVAQSLGVRAGDTVRLGIFGNEPFVGRRLQGLRPIPLTVVGIGAAPGEFQPLAGGYLPGFHLTPAFYRLHRDLFVPGDESIAVKLRGGEGGVRAFRRELTGISEHLHVGFDVPFAQGPQTEGVQQATGAQAIALNLLAVLVAVAAVAIFAQSLARQTFLESIDHPTLRALGVVPGQLLAVGLIRAAVIGVAGAGVAAVTAVLLSPLSPIGVARTAEPNPGLAIDPPVVVLGAVGIVVIVVLVGALPSWRAVRAGAVVPGARWATGGPSRIAAGISRLGGSPSAVTGVRMALEPGRGRTAVPVRTTVLGTGLGMIALAAALVFSASLQHLTTTPRLSGWNWDALVGSEVNKPTGDEQEPSADEKLSALLDRDPRVEGYAVGVLPDLDIGGTPHILSIALETRKGSVTPALAEGRLPAAPDEVALGSQTMSSAGVGIGDTVPVGLNGTTTPLRVVGRIAMPNVFFSVARPGDGAAVSLDWVYRADPRSARDAGFFIKFAPGADGEAVIRDLERAVPALFQFPRAQTQVSYLNEVQTLPLVLAGVMAFMAVATLAHTLVTSIRRRRRDLAILKTIGFSRRQVSATVAWQGSTLAAVAILVGLPLGIVAGRWGWNLLADRLGVVPEPAWVCPGFLVPVLA